MSGTPSPLKSATAGVAHDAVVPVASGACTRTGQPASAAAVAVEDVDVAVEGRLTTISSSPSPSKSASTGLAYAPRDRRRGRCPCTSARRVRLVRVERARGDERRALRPARAARAPARRRRRRCPAQEAKTMSGLPSPFMSPDRGRSPTMASRAMRRVDAAVGARHVRRRGEVARYGRDGRGRVEPVEGQRVTESRAISTGCPLAARRRGPSRRSSPRRCRGRRRRRCRRAWARPRRSPGSSIGKPGERDRCRGRSSG